MNLAIVIDKKKSYLDLYIDRIDTVYPNDEFRSFGRMHRPFRPGPSMSTIHCTVEDMARFDKEVHIIQEATCRCISSGMPIDKEYLIEFTPIEIYYHRGGRIEIRCYDCRLIEVPSL